MSRRPERRQTVTLTTRGRCLLAGGCAAVACAIVLDERDLLRIGVLAAVLPLVALAVTTARRATLRATHRVDRFQFSPGQVGTITVRFTNSGLLPTPTLQVTDAATAMVTEGVRCSLPSIRRGASAVVRYPLHALRRGHFTIGALSVEISDPLELCAVERRIVSQAHVLVVPSITRLLGLPRALAGEAVTTGTAASGITGGEPDVVVRPYSPGDDIRTIAWRASARHDDLLVRTLQPVSQNTAAVLVDTRTAAHAGTDADSSLEIAVSLAASASVHLIRQRYHLDVLDHRGTTIANGAQGPEGVLAALADLAADTDTHLTGTCDPAADLLVAVLGATTLHEAHLLASARPRGCQGVAFLLDTAGWDPGENTRHSTDAQSVLAAAGWRAVVVRRGDDLAAAWRLICADGRVTAGSVAP